MCHGDLRTYALLLNQTVGMIRFLVGNDGVWLLFKAANGRKKNHSDRSKWLIYMGFWWWVMTGSNRRPTPCKGVEDSIKSMTCNTCQPRQKYEPGFRADTTVPGSDRPPQFAFYPYNLTGN